MTLMSAVLPELWTCSVPWNDDGRRMSPFPPTRRVPVGGAPSLCSTKCALGVSSKVLLARASRSGADSSEPPLQAGRPASTIIAANSGAATRRSSMATSPSRPASPSGRTAADSSVPRRSDAGAGPCRDPSRDRRLVLVRQESQRRRQLGQPVLLGREGPEGITGGDAVVGPVHDVHGVARPDVPGLQHPQVGTAGAAGGEALDQPRHAPEAL